ncbi:MAG: polyphosphate polymerase domain-containing protein [Reichenbachiella sp.]|uniref:polyphosphate polymerase domain-containing protein n=1 Tax=Reichenbachiella sp. TaxID=2184521 RepID=UPI0032991ABD
METTAINHNHYQEAYPGLDAFATTDLESLNGLALMNRIDTKYLLPIAKLGDFLQTLAPTCQVLSINNQSVMNYENIYFDTAENDMYLAHHNGRLRRSKIRFRTYENTGVSFLEIKNKNNKGRTHKIRLLRSINTPHFTIPEMAYIRANCRFDPTDLKPKLLNQFKRITLVNYQSGERCTIDTGIFFESGRHQMHLKELAVVEIKRERSNQLSAIKGILENSGVKPSQFSKYCMGRTALEPRLKANRFKKRLRVINKMKTENSTHTL